MATFTATSPDDMPALVGDNGESAMAEAALSEGGICGAPALVLSLLLLLLFL